MINYQLSIAILPFVNIGGDKEQEFFSDGITEEVINALSKFEDLKVISRTSSFFYKDKNVPLQEVGRQLKVTVILEGSVRVVGNKVRLHIQLIHSSDAITLWSEVMNFEYHDIFSIQEEISMQVAEKMREHLGHFEMNMEAKSQVQNISAYELFLRSIHNFYTFRHKNILLAAEQIDKVIVLDPKMPNYHATKAVYYIYLGAMGLKPAEKAYSISEDESQMALEIDNTNPEANYAKGVVEAIKNRNFIQARYHYRMALHYRPNYPEALLGNSMLDLAEGKRETVMEGIDSALELDPLSIYFKFYKAIILKNLGRYKESMEWVDNILEIVPKHMNAYALKGLLMIRLGDYEQAFEHYKTVPYWDEIHPYYAGMAIAKAKLSDFKSAHTYLKKCDESEVTWHITHESNARVLVAIMEDDFDLAFQLLREDIRNNKHYLLYYKGIPDLEPLFQDLRIQELESIFRVEPKEDLPIERIKYRKSGLSVAQVDALFDHIVEVMEEKQLYLDSTISLKSLSTEIGESANNVSRAINDGFRGNFFDFVNGYRVKEVIRLIQTNSNERYSLLGLAFQAGFNSKSTFNMAFKKHEGVTPSQFVRRQQSQ